jgi:hypothetical protein
LWCAAPVRRGPFGIRAPAQGRFLRGSADASTCRRPPGRSEAPGEGYRCSLRPTPQDAARRPGEPSTSSSTASPC